jgi:hypothetical protein
MSLELPRPRRWHCKWRKQNQRRMRVRLACPRLGRLWGRRRGFPHGRLDHPGGCGFGQMHTAIGKFVFSEGLEKKVPFLNARALLGGHKILEPRSRRPVPRPMLFRQHPGVVGTGASGYVRP